MTKVWLVAGAGSGLGHDITEAVLKAGGIVVAGARRPEALASLRAIYGARLLPVELDVRDEDAAQSSVRRASGVYGQLDVLANNAGYQLNAPFEQISSEQFRDVVETCLFGVVHMTRAAAAVLDLATRKVVGWSMRDHRRTELTTAALMMAGQRQKPAAGLVCHSGRGSQYAAEADRRQLAGMKPVPSMSRTARCCDNAPMESFFHTPRSNSSTSDDGRPGTRPDASAHVADAAVQVAGPSAAHPAGSWDHLRSRPSTTSSDDRPVPPTRTRRGVPDLAAGGRRPIREMTAQVAQLRQCHGQFATK